MQCIDISMRAVVFIQDAVISNDQKAPDRMLSVHLIQSHKSGIALAPFIDLDGIPDRLITSFKLKAILSGLYSAGVKADNITFVRLTQEDGFDR